MKNQEKSVQVKPTDAVKIKVVDHVLIKDKNTGKELLNKRG